MYKMLQKIIVYLVVNILNMQSRTAFKRWSFSLRVRREVTTRSKQTSTLRNITNGLGLV
jgi:hypothetical protein